MVERTNLLFVMFDDLRPELSIYGKHHMITPNFERLARKSVVFDNAFCQIAVCNPSRNSLLTGLRPDTLSSFGFESTYHPHLIMPTFMQRAGYKTIGIGKINHWDSVDTEVWNEQYISSGKWYDYQNIEQERLNSTVMPDKLMPIEEYPDYVMASLAIEKLRELSKAETSFLLAVGFKMPHTALHVPMAAFDLYRDRSDALWSLSEEGRTYPPSAPLQGFRCCTESYYRYMQAEGAEPSNRHTDLGNITQPFPADAYREMMWGYSAAVSFVDKQLGRILDTLDELDMWRNLTIILTADHGIHNGEKGIWEKWTLFEESTRVPLFIHHPRSPFLGQRFRTPVELLDLFPTIADLVVQTPLYSNNEVELEGIRKKFYEVQGSRFARKIVPLQGKSLRPVLLGDEDSSNSSRSDTSSSSTTRYVPYSFPSIQSFAISQVLLCARHELVNYEPRSWESAEKHFTVLKGFGSNKDLYFPSPWRDCELSGPNRMANTTAVMGYSMRTENHRYALWLEVDPVSVQPRLELPPLAEQLYDHSGHASRDFVSKAELANLAHLPMRHRELLENRELLMGFLTKSLAELNLRKQIAQQQKLTRFIPAKKSFANGFKKDFKGMKKVGSISAQAEMSHLRKVKKQASQNRASIVREKKGATNFLFIMFDDLRPELNVYGKYHMKTPNFDRLADRSVVFDLAIAQVAVCNPSRNSLLTGLRPDTISSHAFESDYEPYLILPSHLKRAGYTTHGIGKIRHWDDEGDTAVWTRSYNGNWYDYQNQEWDSVFSTVMPDKVRPEETFPDHIFASKAIEALRMYSSSRESFMLAVGFKMPHTCLHVPFSMFDLYRDVAEFQWQLSDQERSFPKTGALAGYRCCANREFRYMNDEGAKVSERQVEIGDPNEPFPADAYREMMWGYSAAVSFVDKQLGRILDTLDELDMWQNLTIILTADHGMHNGEKGIWEKWSLFDESTRVPLFIHHPDSPFAGRHFRGVVELLDLYPTVLDLVRPNGERQYLCGEGPDPEAPWSVKKCPPLQGKSLAPVMFGVPDPDSTDGNAREMPRLNVTFGMSQIMRCAPKEMAVKELLRLRRKRNARQRRRENEATKKIDAAFTAELDADVFPKEVWGDCDFANDLSSEIMLLGYSMRSREYRYSAYFQTDHRTYVPIWGLQPVYEELYDHRVEALLEFGHRELHNLAELESYREVVTQHRAQLIQFLRGSIQYHRLPS